jgi:hypothetical protein
MDGADERAHYSEPPDMSRYAMRDAVVPKQVYNDEVNPTIQMFRYA